MMQSYEKKSYPRIIYIKKLHSLIIFSQHVQFLASALLLAALLLVV